MLGFRCLSKVKHRIPETKDSRSNYAFTLLELMLVAAIILALVALSTPIFRRTYEDLKLTTSAKNIAYTAKFCLERAVFERRDYRLVIDAQNCFYRVFVKDEENKTFKPLKERWGRSFRMPSGIEIKTGNSVVDFSPDGDTDFTKIYLVGKENKTIVISIEAGTGLIKVYDYIEE